MHCNGAGKKPKKIAEALRKRGCEVLIKNTIIGVVQNYNLPIHDHYFSKIITYFLQRKLYKNRTHTVPKLPKK